MDVTLLHGYILGFALIAGWLIIAFWAVALRLLRAEDTPVFWRAVSLAQILIGVQLLVGLGLLLFGRRPGPPGADSGTLLFHLSYGLFSPLVVLFAAHYWARAGRYNAHSLFALAGLVNFGLTFRAWQVGIFGR